MARRRHDEASSSSRDMNGVVKPVQRNAANARERARMRVLSKAFSKLKTSLPWVPADTKLSKLDTLRLASSYISHLKRILDEEPDQADALLHPLNLTWPFSFNLRPTSSAPDGTSSGSESDSPDSGQGLDSSKIQQQQQHLPPPPPPQLLQSQEVLPGALNDLYSSPTSPFVDYLQAFQDMHSNRESLQAGY